MKKEINLSEKNIILFGREGIPTVYLEKDVKEFIKLLKEELKPNRGYKTISFRIICETIDKLAGDDLI